MPHIQRKCTRCRRSIREGHRACSGCGSREAGWVARYRGPDGKERSTSFDRKADAERHLADQRTKIARNEWIDPRLGEEPLGSYFARWQARAARTGKPSERTLIAYREIWRRYIERALGDRQLGSITRAECQAVIDVASSPWRAQDARKVLSRILGAAVRDDLIGRNPAARLDVPKIEWEGPEVATVEQVERLASAIDPRYRALVLLDAYSSLRWSELVGLTVGNVDFLRRRVRVDRKVVESGKLIAGDPKTKRSRRWVSVPESVVLALSEHVDDRLPPGGSERLLFPGPGGGFLRRKTFRRAWVNATEAAGLPGFKVRNLRHTGATLALEAGVNPVLVAFRLGHSSTRMIEAHYGALIESADAGIAERLEKTRGAAEAAPDAGPLRDRGGTRRPRNIERMTE